MSKIDKKINKLKLNPKNDWQINDLKSIADKYEIKYRHQGSSHVVFKNSNGMVCVVPARKPIKPIYIKQFMEILGDKDV